MTNEEAIRELAYGMYDVAAALELAISALEKQIPKRLEKETVAMNAFAVWRRYSCPSCRRFLYSGTSMPASPQQFCYDCGQALDWSD